MIISSSPCPSTFPLHLMKILNARTWKRFTTHDLQEAHPTDRTGVCMELALPSQHQHALFLLVETGFSVKNKHSAFQSTAGMAVAEARKVIRTIPNKSSLTTHQGHADLCPAQTPHKLSQGCWWNLCPLTMLPVKLPLLHQLPHFLFLIINNQLS